MDGNEKNGVAIYCRVSSHEQKKKGDFQRQIETTQEFCYDSTYSVDYIFKDVGSGLNTKRNGLRKLSKLIEERKINKIVIAYKDRLTRFGFDYLKNYFGSYGVKIESHNQTKRVSVQEEIVQDLIEIVTSFLGKVHGLRNHSRKKRKSKKII